MGKLDRGQRCDAMLGRLITSWASALQREPDLPTRDHQGRGGVSRADAWRDRPDQIEFIE